MSETIQEAHILRKDDELAALLEFVCAMHIQCTAFPDVLNLCIMRIHYTAFSFGLKLVCRNEFHDISKANRRSFSSFAYRYCLFDSYTTSFRNAKFFRSQLRPVFFAVLHTRLYCKNDYLVRKRYKNVEVRLQFCRTASPLPMQMLLLQNLPICILKVLKEVRLRTLVSQSPHRKRKQIYSIFIMLKVKLFVSLFALIFGFVAAAEYRSKQLEEKEKKQIRTTQYAIDQFHETVKTAPGYGQTEKARTAQFYTQQASRAADENIAAQRKNVHDQFAKHWQGGSSNGH